MVKPYTPARPIPPCCRCFSLCHPTLLSRDEIRDEIGVDYALGRFQSLGLVHRVNGTNDEFYFATRTAAVAEEASTAFMLIDAEARSRRRGADADR